VSYLKSEMSEFKPFYQDGTEVRPGDVVRRCQERLTTIGDVYPPEHEMSIWVRAQNGCAEILPHTIEFLPLDEDTEFVSRAEADQKPT